MFRRSAPLAALVALACTLAAPAGALVERPAHAARVSRGTSGLETQVLASVNHVRASHGLVPLRLSARLTAAADQHSQEMARLGYFAHESASGAAFWKRVERYYGPRGYNMWSVGENLLWSSPDVDAAGALSMWMHSPEHRENLLNPQWREIGLSALHTSAAPGTYRGLDVTIVTADFGVRR
jgi:uncharacterized protein YkwD